MRPNLSVLLEDVRTRGDRLHPFWAKWSQKQSRLDEVVVEAESLDHLMPANPYCVTVASPVSVCSAWAGVLVGTSLISVKPVSSQPVGSLVMVRPAGPR